MRSVLGSLKFSQSFNPSQDIATVDAHGMFLCASFILLYTHVVCADVSGKGYLYIKVIGVRSAVARSTWKAMREASDCGTGDRIRLPPFFM